MSKEDNSRSNFLKQACNVFTFRIHWNPAPLHIPSQHHKQLTSQPTTKLTHLTTQLLMSTIQKKHYRTTISTTISALFLHMRISEARDGHRVLFDCSCRHPAQQIQMRARFVICARSARPAKRLFANHSTRALVIQIEVPTAVSESLRRGYQR